ncbi:EAL domain-containing protein [Erwinia sp. CPCC 100877]|nr:EAL domain-containing protein [Erwinia sp. CPCC 100877]
MQFSGWYQRNKNKWWCLPLIIPVLLHPLAFYCNVYTELHGVRVVLYYMMPAMMLALMIIFGWAALPGIIVSLLLHYVPLRGSLDGFASVLHYLLTLAICWGGYSLFVPGRNNVSYDSMHHTAARMFWLVFCSSTIFFLLYQCSIRLGLYAARASMLGDTPWKISTLINYQAQLVSCLTGVPFCYFIIRMLRHPRFARSFFSRMRAQFHPNITRLELGLWWGCILLLMSLMLLPLTDSSTIFNTNYSFTLMLPVMIWGAMRFGFLFITSIWTLMILTISHYYYRYLPPGMDYDNQLALTSSCFLVFSLTIHLMAQVTTRQRASHEKVRYVAYIDPVVQMPNLRALTRDLNSHAGSMLCLLRFPELNLLSRNYGMLLRIAFKQEMANWMNSMLQEGELLYHLSSDELALRLNGETQKERIEALDEQIRQFRFSWDGMPFQLQVGISYSYVRAPLTHHYLLLGELGIMADHSVHTGHPESLQLYGARHVQNAVKSKVDMMNQLQQALDHDGFCLLAQPIEGVRGDIYHEILLRMKGENGEIIEPGCFLPVAHEFGLSSRIDLWVLEKIMTFISEHREVLPASRFSVNLTPASVCRPRFVNDVQILLKRYDIQPWQLVFEVTESHSLTNVEQASLTLSALQHMGCRVAIDDFGTGYASYARLRDLNADMMKIDGSFIRNLLVSSLDYQIVASICQLARTKKMQLVAESVETEEIREAIRKLGIDYMQGWAIGRPQPLEMLVQGK